jgi:WD40 repeat protein
MTMATAATSDGSKLATAAADGTVMVIDAATGAVRWDADPWTDDRMAELAAADPGFADTLTDWVVRAAFSPDGRVLAVAGENPEVVLYDAANGSETARWTASRHGWVNGMSFAADGSLVTAGDDGRVVVWDVVSQEPKQEYEILPEPADSGSWTGAPFDARHSPDGSRLAVLIVHRGAPVDLTVLDTESGEPAWTEVADEFMAIPGWSPDGATVAVGGWQSGALTLRSAETGQVIGEPVLASAGFVLSTEYSADGQLIVTSGTDGTVRLWDAATLKQIGTTLPQSEHGWATAHVLTDDAILSVSDAGRYWRWDLSPSRWAEQACTVANRTLTEPEWHLFLGDAPYTPACVAGS